jgi:hypothetical protein
MSDETKPDDPRPNDRTDVAAGDPVSAARPADWSDLFAYAKTVGKWGLFVLATTVAVALTSWLAVKLGVPVPTPAPPPAPTAEETAKAVVEVVKQAQEENTEYYCGRVETIRDQIVTRPWPVKTLTWTVLPAGYRGTISPIQIREAFAVAFAAWGAHLEMEIKYVESADQALAVCRFGDIDGNGKVLAWSELADGTKTVKHQLYDSGERWEISARPTQIDLVRVVAHEAGHLLGLVHADPDSGQLMAPMYDRSIRLPTATDVKRLYAMGYAPKPLPPGGQPTIPNLNLTIDAAQILRALDEAGYKVEKK